MSRKEREDAVGRMRKGESWVMVTTEVMARGMDFKGVREVVNYDFPRSVQSYVHRVGAYRACFSCSPLTDDGSAWSCRSNGKSRP